MFVRFFERVSDLFDRQQKKKERKKKSPLRFHSSEDRLLISMQGLLYYYHYRMAYRHKQTTKQVDFIHDSGEKLPIAIACLYTYINE